LALLVVVAVVTGCGVSEDPVLARTQHFKEALRSQDWSDACADLAVQARVSLENDKGKRCEEAIGSERLPVRTPSGPVRLYGSMAQVSTGDDTVFLSRFEDGWLIVAAGCRSTGPDQPYTCTLEVR